MVKQPRPGEASARVAGVTETAATVPWRAAKDGLRLAVRLTPKSSRDEVGGMGVGPDGPYLAVKVRALPSEGAANAALEKVVAKWLGLAQRDVALTAGGKSRLKTLHLSGDPTELAGTIRVKLGDAGR